MNIQVTLSTTIDDKIKQQIDERLDNFGNVGYSIDHQKPIEDVDIHIFIVKEDLGEGIFEDQSLVTYWYDIACENPYATFFYYYNTKSSELVEKFIESKEIEVFEFRRIDQILQSIYENLQYKYGDKNTMDPLFQFDIRNLWFDTSGYRSILYYAFLLTKDQSIDQKPCEIIELLITPDQIEEITSTLNQLKKPISNDSSSNILNDNCTLVEENGVYMFVRELVGESMGGHYNLKFNALDIYAKDRIFRSDYSESDENLIEREKLWLREPYNILASVFDSVPQLSVSVYGSNNLFDDPKDVLSEQIVIIKDIENKRNLAFIFMNVNKLRPDHHEVISDLQSIISNYYCRAEEHLILVAAPTLHQETLRYLKHRHLLAVGPINLEPYFWWAEGKSEEWRRIYFNLFYRYIDLEDRDKGTVIGSKKFYSRNSDFLSRDL